MIGRMSSHQIHQSGLDVILDAQKRLSRTQEELASGKRLLTPADDPVAAAQIQSIRSELTRIETLQSNVTRAASELAMVEDSVANIESILMRARELAVRGSNASLSRQDKDVIATEIDGLRDQLLAAANTLSADGEYIFGGYAVGAAPYAERDINTTFAGDSGAREVNIAKGLTVKTRISGEEVFGEGDAGFLEGIPSPLNSGLASVKVTVNATADLAELGSSYRVQYAETGFTVTNLDTGEVIEYGPEDSRFLFIDGMSIETTAFSTEFAGDTFTIQSPSVVAGRALNAFEALSVLSKGLRDAADTEYFSRADNFLFNRNVTHEGERVTSENAVSIAMQALDVNLENVRSARTDLGTRMNRVEDQQLLNDNFNVRLQETLSGLEDLDYTKAITEMNLQMVALEAAQKAYTKTQGLSLFNYL